MEIGNFNINNDHLKRVLKKRQEILDKCSPEWLAANYSFFPKILNNTVNANITQTTKTKQL